MICLWNKANSSEFKSPKKKKSPGEGRTVVHGWSFWPLSSWQWPVTTICSYALCIHCILSPHPLPTSPSLPTLLCILLTRASNFLSFHDPSPISIHMWSLFSFWKFSDSFPTFRLFSNYFPTPIKSAVTEANFSKMLCSLHVCPTWTWKDVGWILDMFRNHPITVKAADPWAFSLSTHNVIFFF